jgi:hypothetical protein
MIRGRDWTGVKLLAIILALAASACASPSAFARWRAPLSAEVELPMTTMAAGSSMSGRVVVENGTGYAIRSTSCGSPFQVALGTDQIQPIVAWDLCLGRFTLPAGESSWPVTVDATYGGCADESADDTFPRCMGDGNVPPLPPGVYRVELFQSQRVVPAPPPITIRVTP